MDNSAYVVFVLIFSAVALLIWVLLRERNNRDKIDADSLIFREKREQAQPSFSAPGVRFVEGRAHIVDGDSIIISNMQIRLFGIDAPEINHPHGQNAKWALIALCKGQIVSASIKCSDGHGRFVAKCLLPDGRDLSAEMVKRGLAIDWPKFSGGIYRHLEVPEVRKKLWLADARQKGRMHVWAQFEANRDQNR